MHVMRVIEDVIENQYQQGQLYEQDQFRLGYLQALDTLNTQLNILLSIDDMDDLLDQEHDAVFHLNDKRFYRLDKVSESRPFIEPVPAGYGGKKRYVEGTNLNGLFPGIKIASPNYSPKW